jgi:hypothetical protein
MQFTLQHYWVTIEIERGRTADRRITARSPWAAHWLYTQLHPAETVLMVRQVK